MTPLILLVGFLGSGKTTYLRKFLPALRSAGVDPHVIINDYQNARVDAELLRELTGSITPISGSCVCCGSRDELLGALEKFEHGRDRVIVIETNGTTDSEELIELLALEPALAAFTQPIQLSVIDAQRWQKRFWHNSLELEQARTASFLFVSRWEDTDAKRRETVSASLAKNHIHAAHRDPVAFATEIQTVLAETGSIPSRENEARPAGCDRGPHHEHHGNPGHSDQHGYGGGHGHHSAHHFASMQIDLPHTVPRSAVSAFLDGLPREVIRVKGLARLAESPDEFHVFQRVDDGATQWLPIGATTRLGHPVVVLIGPGIDPEPIQARAAKLFGTNPGAL
jgi:G3E family GTPase